MTVVSDTNTCIALNRNSVDFEHDKCMVVRVNLKFACFFRVIVAKYAIAKLVFSYFDRSIKSLLSNVPINLSTKETCAILFMIPAGNKFVLHR